MANVKTVTTNPVKGDGVTDEIKNLQAILDANADTKKLLYFPHGVYLISDTFAVPSGVNLVGASFIQLTATTTNFENAASPRPMIKVSNAGDIGHAHITGFVFIMAGILPGLVMVEVNMAGPAAGDVDFFKYHFRIFGVKGSKVKNDCTSGIINILNFNAANYNSTTIALITKALIVSNSL